MAKPNRLHLAVLSAMMGLSHSAMAADLDTVDVTASLPKEASQTITTTSAALEENGNSETGTALRQINGVDASRMGGHGVDLIIRGQTASQLNILLDGAKIEGGCPNRMDPATAYAEISSYDLITVIKGVGTLTQAAGGTGGTVLFERETPAYDPDNIIRGELNLGTSNNGLKEDINATVTARSEKFYMELQGATKDADNYQDGDGNEIRSSYESDQGHIDLGWTPNKHHEVKFSYERSVIQDALFQGAMMDSPESDGSTTRLQYKGKDLGGVVSDIDFSLYSSDVDHVMDNFSYRNPTIAESSKMINSTNAKTDGAKIKLTSMVGHTQLDYGIQTETIQKISDLHKTNDTTVWYMWPQTKSVTNSVFAESTSFFKDNQKVIMGLRYDMFDAQADKADQATAGGTPATVYNNVYGTTDTDNSANKLSALIRYEKKLNAQMELFAGFSRSYRFPDATELYIVKGDSWTGNPDLKPEEHNQLDFGFAQNGENLQWSASAFYDKVNDYIVMYMDGGQRYGNRDANLYGFEFSVAQAFNRQFTAGFDANVTYGENTTDNRDLANMTPLSGKFFADYRSGNLQAGARLNFAKAQTQIDSTIGEVETAGWSTIDVYGQYQINKTLTVMAGIDNLFDRTYQDAHNRVDPLTGKTYNLNEPGRIIWAKMNVKF